MNNDTVVVTKWFMNKIRNYQLQERLLELYNKACITKFKLFCLFVNNLPQMDNDIINKIHCYFAENIIFYYLHKRHRIKYATIRNLAVKLTSFAPKI